MGKEYEKEKEFVQKIAEAYQLGENKSRASVITFSNEAKLSIKFNQFYDQASFAQAVSEIPFFGGKTKIDKALSLAESEMFKEVNGARSGVPDTLILLTDGKSNDDPKVTVKKLRSRGVNIIVLGITKEVNDEMLRKIAGDSKNYFTAENFDILISKEFIETLQVKICETGENLY